MVMGDGDGVWDVIINDDKSGGDDYDYDDGDDGAPA